jgi:hypothetical protein
MNLSPVTLVAQLVWLLIWFVLLSFVFVPIMNASGPLLKTVVFTINVAVLGGGLLFCRRFGAKGKKR